MRGPILGLSLRSVPSRLGLWIQPIATPATVQLDEASPSPPLPLACLPSHVSSVSPRPCLVLMVRFNFRTWANHDRRPRTAPPSGTQYSTLDGWGNGKSSVAPLLCRADASFAGARGLVQRAILGHGIHVTLYRSHRLLSVPPCIVCHCIRTRSSALYGLPGAAGSPLKTRRGFVRAPVFPGFLHLGAVAFSFPSAAWHETNVPVLAATPCPRAVALCCVGSSVFVCLLACLAQGACLITNKGSSARIQVRCFGFRLVRIPSSGRLSCAVPSLTSRRFGKGAASHQQLDKEMALLVDLQRDGRLWRIRLPGPGGSKRKHL